MTGRIWSCWARGSIIIMALACDGRSSRGWHDEDRESLIISITPEAQQGIRLGRVERVIAPAVEFAGLVVEDRSHYPPVLAPDSGTVATIRPKGAVRLGDTLLTARGIGGEFVATADREGMWQPSEGTARRVEVGDTIGTLGRPGTWIAEGAVGDYQGAQIHAGDPATVRIWGDPDSLITGTVEWVRRPVDPARGSTTVGVEFPHAPRAGHGGTSALITVTPSDPDDSVLAIPEKALVRLSSGLALFIPQGGERYQVRFVLIGPTIGGLVVLREGLDETVRIVIEGVDSLKLAAEDSLRQRRSRQ